MAEDGQVIGCHTESEWNQHFERGTNSGKLVVVDFTATWCGPCRMIAPIFAELAKKLPSVIFLKVDVDELQSVAEHWKIEAMPTFVFLKGGKELDRSVGAHKDDLHKKIEQLSAETTTTSATA